VSHRHLTDDNLGYTFIRSDTSFNLHQPTIMEARRPPEYTLDIVADRTNVKDVVKGTTNYSQHVRCGC
jgi:hypothetical protein